MSDERLGELERKVTDLRITNATLAQSVEHLTVAVTALNDTVQILRDTMNKGRGALWLAMTAAGISGAAGWVLISRKLGL